eukprot:12428388-Karenia_brevis.AAC.1
MTTVGLAPCLCFAYAVQKIIKRVIGTDPMLCLCLCLCLRRVARSTNIREPYVHLKWMSQLRLTVRTRIT